MGNWDWIGPKFWNFIYTQGGTKKLSGMGNYQANSGICSAIEGKDDDKTSFQNFGACETKMRECTRIRDKMITMAGGKMKQFDAEDAKLNKCVSRAVGMKDDANSKYQLNQDNRASWKKSYTKFKSSQLRGKPHHVADIDRMCQAGHKNEDFEVPSSFKGVKGSTGKEKFKRAISQRIDDVQEAKDRVKGGTPWKEMLLGIKSWFKRWVFYPSTTFEEDLNKQLTKTASMTENSRAAKLVAWAAKNRTFGPGATSDPTAFFTQNAYKNTLWQKMHKADELNKDKTDLNFVENYRADLPGKPGTDDGACVRSNKIKKTVNLFWKQFRPDRLLPGPRSDSAYEISKDCVDALSDNGRATAIIGAASAYASSLADNVKGDHDDLLGKYKTHLVDCQSDWNRVLDNRFKTT